MHTFFEYVNLSKNTHDLFVYSRPTRIFEAQVSIDDRRRSELANILRDADSREAVRILEIFQFQLFDFAFLASQSMDEFNRRKKRNGNIRYRKKI